MKILKSLSVLGLFAILTACGSGTGSTGIATSPYGYNYNYNNGGQSGFNGSGTTTSIPGGTKTLTQIMYSGATTSGSYYFPGSVSVVAGDQIIVQASGATVSRVNAFYTYSNLPLGNLSINLNGTMLGAGLNATYRITTPGTITIGADWSGDATGTHIIYFPSYYNYYSPGATSGVFLAHCVSTAGAAMACP